MTEIGHAVLITGAASGIGAALARRMAGPGQALALHGGGTTAESARRLQEVLGACAATGARCIVTSGNLTEAGQGTACVEAALAAFGRLDAVVHSAGHVDKTPLGKLSRAGLDHNLALMAGSLLEMVTAAMPALAACGAGRVVAVSTFTVHKIEGATFAPGSTVAKAAMEALVRCFALQLAPSGITVNAVVPGFTRKDPGKPGTLSPEGWALAAKRAPTGRLNEADDVAAAIQFLLSPVARQITGALIPVDGGLMLG